jgi:hypothetical protein
MPKEKKNWREQQRDRQVKQKQTDEENKKRREIEAKNKPRKLPKGKIIFGVCLIAIILASYATWQYVEGQKPPTIGGSTSGQQTTSVAPNFSLQDINGTKVSLNQFKDKVVGIHFMAVGCHGNIEAINSYELTQLSNACNSVCKGNVTFLTVAVATCENSQLDVLRSNYGVTWVLGNDYADGALEIVNSYVPFGIGDGTIILLDKDHNIAEIYNQGVASNTLVSRINQLTGA